MSTGTSECKHFRTLFIQSSEGGPPHMAEYVTVCPDCGEFKVTAAREGVTIVTRFTLPSWSHVRAASQYARILDAEESPDRAEVDHGITRAAKQMLELAMIGLMRRLPSDDPARRRAANVLALYGDRNAVMREKAASKPDDRPECVGKGRGGTGRCCPRAGEYNGFGSDGPLAFACPIGCSCHD